MKIYGIFVFLTLSLISFAAIPVDKTLFDEALKDFRATMVIVDVQTGETFAYHPELCREPLSPCSTFKIVNTLCALENGVIESENTVIAWDGKVRPVAAWNRDLTLKEAVAVSAVPHFQSIAARIGTPVMQNFLDKINYGNRNISGGITSFWLGSSLLISVEQQTGFLLRLINGELPVSERSLRILHTVLFQMDGKNSKLYGKTGTDIGADSKPCLGWYVGWIERDSLPTYVFALNLRGNAKADGKTAKTTMIVLLQKMELL